VATLPGYLFWAYATALGRGPSRSQLPGSVAIDRDAMALWHGPSRSQLLGSVAIDRDAMALCHGPSRSQLLGSVAIDRDAMTLCRGPSRCYSFLPDVLRSERDPPRRKAVASRPRPCFPFS